jgi:fumarate reductase flavoprotein subunit
MELPPGWRGYGARDYIDHPDTPARQKEVEALRAKLEPSGRSPCRRRSCRTSSCCHPVSVARNERIDERF